MGGSHQHLKTDFFVACLDLSRGRYRDAPAADQFFGAYEPARMTGLAPALGHAGRNCLEDLRGKSGPPDMAGRLHHGRHFFNIPTRFLNADDVGMVCQFGNHLQREVVGCERWHSVKQDRQGRSIGDRPVERQQGLRLHLRAIKMGSPHQGDIILEPRSVFCKPESLTHRFSPRARDQDFFRSCHFGCDPQHLAPLFIAQHHRFPG